MDQYSIDAVVLVRVVAGITTTFREIHRAEVVVHADVLSYSY